MYSHQRPEIKTIHNGQEITFRAVTTDGFRPWRLIGTDKAGNIYAATCTESKPAGVHAVDFLYEHDVVILRAYFEFDPAGSDLPIAPESMRPGLD